MAQNALSLEFEETLKGDCNKLFEVLKRTQDADNLKILYRIVFLISNRQGSKMMAVTNFTVKYICQHPTLPLILVDILRTTHSLKECTYVLEILAKLIMKNSTTSEADRKSIRKFFYEPSNFRAILDAFQCLYQHFIHEKTNTIFYDIQLRLLKIINCLYLRRGQSQISQIPNATVEFLGRHVNRYKSHKDISQSMLPLIKVICRNKKNCALVCSEAFLISLVNIVPTTNKYPTAIALLRLLSRNPDAVYEMSHSEKTFHFILNTALHHTEKLNHKKYLMTTLYRITRSHRGIQNISKPYLWNMLLEFFTKIDKLEELKQRISASKAYTVLNRGINTLSMTITPSKLNLNLSDEIQEYIDEISNLHSDDSDNDESEDEEEKRDQGKSPTRAASEESDDEDGLKESDDEEDVQINDEELEEESNYDSIDFVAPYYQEFYPEVVQVKMRTFHNICFYKNNLNRVLENRVQRNSKINKQAFPDAVFAESDANDAGSVATNINYVCLDDMARKARILKGMQQGGFERKTVFDLDKLIETDEESDLPEPEVLRLADLASINRNVQISSRMRRNPPTLQFESRFECGNLRKVEQVAHYEYNLFISPDINMTNGLQWFYFQVSNMLPAVQYTFNIVNFQKANSQFNYGLQPVMFSVNDFLSRGTGWRKVGEKMMYFGNESFDRDTGRQYRTLTFTVSFPYYHDYSYFAYHFPYTYTRMLTSILPCLEISDDIYSRVDRLTMSVNDLNEVPLITVTAKSSNTPLEERALVFLTARVHPGESNSSWIMDGVVRFLMSMDERAARARERYIFKIIPMLNPEGVIYGNSRCGLTGNDLNRCWKKPHPVLHPEIYYAKKLVQFARERLCRPIFAFIDIHGHSRKKYFFLYGCNPKQSWNDGDKTHADSSDSSYNILPKALSANENMKMSFCRNTIERKKESTCRVVMWREFGIKCSHTLECSYCSGEGKKKVTTKMLRDIGASIITSLAAIADG